MCVLLYCLEMHQLAKKSQLNLPNTKNGKLYLCVTLNLSITQLIQNKRSLNYITYGFKLSKAYKKTLTINQINHNTP